MAFETDFIEGFDAYGVDETAMGKAWFRYGTTLASLSDTVHRGASGSSMLFDSSSTTVYILKSFKKSYKCIIVGFAVYYLETVATTAIDETPLCIVSGSIDMITLHLEPGGYFTLRRGPASGTVIATGTTVVPNLTWHYLELKVFIDDSAGAFEFKINGATEFSDTAVDTNYSSSVDTVTGLRFENVGGSGPYDFHIDDVYARGDVTTNTAGGFFGDTRVEVIRPDADGTYEQWTLSTGTDEFALIDELLPDTVDYLEGDTAAEKYTVSHGSFTGTGTIFAVEQYVHTTMPDNNPRDLYPLCRSNSVDYQLGAVRAKDSAYISHVYDVDPNTSSAWVLAALNAAEFGLEIA